MWKLKHSCEADTRHNFLLKNKRENRTNDKFLKEVYTEKTILEEPIRSNFKCNFLTRNSLNIGSIWFGTYILATLGKLFSSFVFITTLKINTKGREMLKNRDVTRGWFHKTFLGPMPIFCTLPWTFKQIKSLSKVGHRAQSVWRRAQSCLWNDPIL